MLFTLANLISLLRVPLAPLSCYYFALSAKTESDALFFSLMILTVIALDGLDGFIARSMKQESPIGAKLDIYCDRAVELLFMVYFAFVFKSLPAWVFYFFLFRGIIVDSLSFKDDKPLGDSFLRGSRFMRAVSGVLKVLMFTGLAWNPLYLSKFISNPVLDFNIVELVVYLSVLVSFLRGLPTVIDFFKSKNIIN
ncbi:MAG: CDP-alcohol phosphatidyltransferase family protein [bacterium]